jgi:hypothetical protein
MYRPYRSALLIFLLAASAAQAQETPRLRLVSERMHNNYLSYWPHSSDRWLSDLKKQDIVFYNDAVMPGAYQFWDGMMPGVHSPSYNISAVRSEPIGNANREFPWGSPAGLHGSPNAKSFRFVSFPKGKAIAWWRQRLPYDGGRPSYVWQYPTGTIFGEVLLVSDPEGYDYTFELRTRLRTEKGWAMNAFRPFTTHAELASRVKELAPNWKSRPELVALVSGDDSRDEVWRLRNQHDLVTFDSVAVSTPLPAIEHDLVRKLLDTPFRSALGQEWKRNADGVEAFAPTTEADFHIVPKNYQGGFIEVSSKSCMRCHDTTLKHASEVQYRRDWYGRVRGSDNIFSFHIFEPSSISHNGFGREPALRQDLLAAGLLKQWEE